MYSVGQFGKIIGRSIKTLQRWDNIGELKAHRTPTNRRYYTKGQLLEYIEREWLTEFCASHPHKMLLANDESLSPGEEIIKDLLLAFFEFSQRISKLQRKKVIGVK